MTVKVINKSNNLLPQYETLGAAGLDIRANIKDSDIMKSENVYHDKRSNRIQLLPGGRVLIPTGLYTAIPEGYHLDIRPRSGLALKYGISVLNSPGLIDPDYRNEIGVILINFGNTEFIINDGDRIAQMVLMKTKRIEWQVVDQLDETDRNLGGFGSTGK